MPANLSVSLNIIAKTAKLTVLLLFFPLIFWGQKLTGLWTGTFKGVTGDSLRKDQSFEIALTEYRGKVYGYSRSEFIIHDTLNYILKRIKGTITDDSCEVKDDEIISYNFPGKLEKKVKVILVFRMNKKDSTWHLDGNWRTTKTKNFYSITGKVQLQEQKDFNQSTLFPDLEELNLAKDVAFYQEQKKKNDAVAKEQLSKSKDLGAASDKKQTEEKILELDKIKVALVNYKDSIAFPSIAESTKNQSEIISSLSELKKIDPVIQDKKPDLALVKKELRKNELSQEQLSNSGNLTAKDDKIYKQEKISKAVKIDELHINRNESIMASSISESNKKQSDIVSSLSESKKNKNTDLVLVKNESRKKEQSAAIISSEIKKNNPSEPITNTKIKTEDLDISKPAAFAAERKSEISQIVNFKSDSLELVLYDNGEVDGDTVSILMNGNVIIPKQGLLAVAYKKTIYLPKNIGDSVVLTMYAENLGKYPPNTGLLIIHDGDDSYQVHFTADLQTNAAVILKRKRSQ